MRKKFGKKRAEDGGEKPLGQNVEKNDQRAGRKFVHREEKPLFVGKITKNAVYSACNL